MDIVSSIVFISCPSFEDMFREFGFAFCVSELFSMFFESCVEVSVGSFYIKFVAVGACQFINPLLVQINSPDTVIQRYSFSKKFTVTYPDCSEWKRLNIQNLSKGLVYRQIQN